MDVHVRSRSLRLRFAALLAVAAFAAHQLRFLLAYGHDAGHVLSEPGHEYLPFAEALVLVVLAVALAQFARAALSRRSDVPIAPASFGSLWLRSSAAITAIYLTQESIEGAFAPGHPVLAHGGWLIAPIAIALGAAVAALMRGADRVLVHLSRRARPGVRRAAPLVRSRGLSIPRPRLAALACNLAGRAPPVAA
jgi:hypothetical protein